MVGSVDTRLTIELARMSMVDNNERLLAIYVLYLGMFCHSNSFSCTQSYRARVNSLIMNCFRFVPR
jgi:hypothetical protein